MPRRGNRNKSSLDICGKDVWKEVVLPIELPELTPGIFEKLRSRENEITATFREYALGMGVNEVFFPYIDGCRLSFDPVDTLAVYAWLFARNVGTDATVFAVALHAMSARTKRTHHIVFPIARWGEAKYKDAVYSVLLADAFIEKNPVVIEALRKAVEDAISTAVATYDAALKFYNALRMLGAEDAEPA